MTEEHIEHLGNGACDGRNDGPAMKNVVSDPDGGSDIAYIASKRTETERYGLEPDSREKLEEEASELVAYYAASGNVCDALYHGIIALLDRQVAITANETSHDNPYVGLVRGKQWERTEISDYYCGRCGWKVTDHDSYCPECGGALHKASNKPDSKFDARETAETPETEEVSRDGESTEVIGAICPFTSDGMCHTNCMLFTTAVDSDVTCGDMGSGDGHCSLAVMASHIASEKHHGGNYLVASVALGNVG